MGANIVQVVTQSGDVQFLETPGSGEAYVALKGYDYESAEWRRVRVTGSGEIAIQVTVADIVTAKISGETVALQSGTGPVWNKISGESVVVTSGQVVAKISGESVVVTSGQVVAKISGESLVVTSGLVVAKVSGETVSLPSTQVVKISGETIKISGETLSVLSPSTILAGYTMIAASSGGTQLSSGVIVLAKVRNLPGNANMWLGPIGVLSGTGYLLQGGEHDEFEMGNTNAVYLIATTSGEYVSFRGVN